MESAPAFGYQVVEKTLHDVNKIQDFAPYVAKIRATNADTVITGNWSNDLLLLMKAASYGGLKVRFGTVFLDQPGNLANAGDTALGHYVVHMYNIEAAGEEGAKFVEDYKAKTGHIPSYVEPSTVIGMQLVGEALKGTKPVDGKMNITELAKNLEKAKVKTAARRALAARRRPPGDRPVRRLQGDHRREVQDGRHGHGVQAGARRLGRGRLGAGAGQLQDAAAVARVHEVGSPGDGVLHRLAAERRRLRTAAVHGLRRAHPHLRDDGGPELRARVVLHARRVLRVHAGRAHRVRGGAGRLPDPRRPRRRRGGAGPPAACPPVRARA